jgi:hypothetical protein
MATFDDFVTQWKAAVGDFAAKSYSDFKSQASNDAQSFFNDAEQNLVRWTSMLGDGTNGTLSENDFTSLVEGERTLLELHALKQAGLAEARWDLFTNGILNLTVQTALKVFL